VSNKAVSDKTNKEEVFHLIQRHPEGQDDDICRMTGIMPRQQVQQLCNRLAASNRIRRESIEKPRKRRKIHNFPIESGETADMEGLERFGHQAWHRLFR